MTAFAAVVSMQNDLITSPSTPFQPSQACQGERGAVGAADRERLLRFAFRRRYS